MEYMVKNKRGDMEVVTAVPEGKKYRLSTGELCTKAKLHPVEETTGGPLGIPKRVKGVNIKTWRLIEVMMYNNDRRLRHQARMAVEAGCTTFLSVYRWVFGRFKRRKSLRDCPRAFRRGAANVIAEEASLLGVFSGRGKPGKDTVSSPERQSRLFSSE